MKRIMDEGTYQSLRALVVYASIEEGRHFEEEDRPRKHIYRHIMRLAKWVDANNA